MAAVQQGHHFPPFHRSIRKAPCISPPRLRCKEPTPNLTGGGTGIIPSPSGKYKEEFNLNERDQLLVKIRFTMFDDLVKILSNLSEEDLRLVYIVALELSREDGGAK